LLEHPLIALSPKPRGEGKRGSNTGRNEGKAKKYHCDVTGRLEKTEHYMLYV